MNTLNFDRDPKYIFKKLLLFTLLASLFTLLASLFTLLCSCSTTKTIPVETIKEVTKTDTLYLNTFRFDSTYVSYNLLTDRSRDTILIKETNTETRYKILRDTVERVKLEIKRDSIPYKVTVTEVREVPRPLTWFDHLTRTTFWLLLGFLLYILYRFIHKFF